jgi:hypothetical protein
MEGTIDFLSSITLEDALNYIVELEEENQRVSLNIVNES